MARRKREPMSEGKKNIIGMLLEEYDIKSAKDIEMPSKTFLEGRSRKCLSPKWTSIWDIRNMSVPAILSITTAGKPRKFAETSEKLK